KKKIEALSMVLPEFDNSPIDESFKIATDDDSVVCYIGKKGDEIVGVAIESFTNKGFSGRFDIMVGLTPDGIIYNTVMLEHKETPGLGDKTEKEKSDWTDQFMKKNPLEFNIKVKKDGGDVHAITAATITSRAYIDAIQRAIDAFNNEVLKEIKK
ncbi:MAG: RnfABCDGE type electron transport complex subunit G, partial [Bacteroidota bacterium]|nr:RnfABCDGE type electron transport complex subunit G [Bacteroidota bacterium]